MALHSSRVSAEPLMDTSDKLAAEKPYSREAAIEKVAPARPFGLRFAVSPIRAGDHSKTYYTVTETEETQVSRDGVVETIVDSVNKEKED